jgi:hypothetical protein
MNFFEEYIQKLGLALGTSLHAEKGYLCKLLIDGVLKVQLEHEAAEERILIASFLCEIPPGKFREDLLKEALKANDAIDRPGTFAYSPKNNSLTYFLYLSDKISFEEFEEKFLQWLETAKQWRSAVETGNIFQLSRSRPSSPSFFGRP